MPNSSTTAQASRRDRYAITSGTYSTKRPPTKRGRGAERGRLSPQSSASFRRGEGGPGDAAQQTRPRRVPDEPDPRDARLVLRRARRRGDLRERSPLLRDLRRRAPPRGVPQLRPARAEGHQHGARREGFRAAGTPPHGIHLRVHEGLPRQLRPPEGPRDPPLLLRQPRPDDVDVLPRSRRQPRRAADRQLRHRQGRAGLVEDAGLRSEPDRRRVRSRRPGEAIRRRRAGGGARRPRRLMADDLLRETIQLRYPRLLASGVDYNDAQTVLGRIRRFDDWRTEWVAMGQAHERLGDEALRDGHPPRMRVRVLR